jgi:hypothetical protein
MTETNDEIIANRLAIIALTLGRMETLLETMAENSADQTHILKSIAKTLDDVG